MSARLDRVVRRYLASVAVSRFGTGLTLPFTLIYLHEVRGIDLPTVGLLLAVPAVVGLAAVPLSGALVDRIGPRPVLRGCLLTQATGTTLLAFGHTPWQVLPGLLLQGIGIGPSFPTGSALLSGLLTRPEQAQRAFGIQFTVINAAIGLGSLVGAAVVDVRDSATFVGLFLGSALTCMAQALVLPAAPRPEPDRDAEAPSYREVWSDPVFRQLCLVSFLFAMTCYAALDSGLPAFARVEGDVPPSTIALVFTVNTVLIVALQLPVLRWVQHWRRTRALAAAAAMWTLSWGLLGVSQATVVVLMFGAVFGLGEVFLAPAMQPLVNALASDRLRGRYNALSGAMFSIAFVISPALSGVLIGNGLGWLWISGLVGGSFLTAVMVLRLSRRLTDEQDGLPGACDQGSGFHA